MKHAIVFLVLFQTTILLTAQTTYVPDDNFEQALIYYGLDDVMDDYVLTANITNVEYLQLYNLNISDLTGIEDFTNLVGLNVKENNLTSLDISNSQNLEILACDFNQLTELDVSQNLMLYSLKCEGNLLTNLDVSQNVLLRYLTCGNNYISEIDLRNNINLENFVYNSYISYPYMQAIESIDLRNGNNTNISFCSMNNNVNLKCVFVDDKNAPHPNWHLSHGNYVNNEAECDAILNVNNFIEKSIMMYPNPVAEILYIENMGNLNIQRIELYDNLGRRIMDLSNGFDQVNFEDFSSGVYFVNIQTDNGLIKKKIIKI